jgi:hypothetical protein
MIKPQSIRKGTTIFVNNNIVDKQVIIELSSGWTLAQETLFRKTLKQSGEISINGNKIKVIAQEQILTSKGEKDPGKLIAPGADTRF